MQMTCVIITVMDAFSQFLKSKGYRITKFRIAILQLLHSSKTPLAADEIKSNLDKQGVFADLVTVYRFLNTFVDVGLLHKIEFGEGRYRYELASLPHHHHVVCDSCGDIEDIQIDENELTKKLKTKSRFKIDHHHLEFFGLCANCQ